MRGFKCFGCQQVFDNKRSLFSHLQQNTSHKRSRPKPKSRSQSQPQIHAERRDNATVVFQETSVQIPAVYADQYRGSEPSWLYVTAEQDAYLREIIPSKCHPPETLRTWQYHLENRTSPQLEQLQACLNCNQKRTNPRSANRPCVFHADRRKAKGKRNPRARTCCTSKSRGCQTLPEHVYPSIVYDDFETSPSKLAASKNEPNISRRFAVVVDCEMVEVEGGLSELAQLCVLDLTTAEVLVNRYVQPTRNVIDWRTRYSGITAGGMALAVYYGLALQGWKAARMELWKYIDCDTIIVGHALQHDLRALHLIHHRVADTSIMTRLAVDPACKRCWSLESLSAELADHIIRNNGVERHDCLEDTLATREVFLQSLLRPEKLEIWANRKRAEEQLRKSARDLIISQRKGKATRLAALHDVRDDESDYGEDYDESEALNWSDIAEDLGGLTQTPCMTRGLTDQR